MKINTCPRGKTTSTSQVESFWLLKATIPSFKYADIRPQLCICDVFASDIYFDLYLQLFDTMGQTNRMIYFQRFAKTH